MTDRPGRAPRYPRYGRFIASGALVGFVLAAILTWGAPENADFTKTQLLLYLGLVFALVGALAGGGVAVLLEPRRRREGPRGGPRRSGDGGGSGQ